MSLVDLNPILIQTVFIVCLFENKDEVFRFASLVDLALILRWKASENKDKVLSFVSLVDLASIFKRKTFEYKDDVLNFMSLGDSLRSWNEKL